jgi:hypothetical protein
MTTLTLYKNHNANNNALLNLNKQKPLKLKNFEGFNYDFSLCQIISFH